MNIGNTQVSKRSKSSQDTKPPPEISIPVHHEIDDKTSPMSIDTSPMSIDTTHPDRMSIEPEKKG